MSITESVKTHVSTTAVDEAVLQALRAANQPVTMPELAESVKNKIDTALDEFEVRRSVWRLVSEGSIELTPDRRLKSEARAT
jgi:hypothetical protein